MIFNKKKSSFTILKLCWDIIIFYSTVTSLFKFINFKINSIFFRFFVLNLFQSEIKKFKMKFNENRNKKINENDIFLKIEKKCDFLKFSNFFQFQKNISYVKKNTNHHFPFFSAFNFLYSFTSFDYFSKHNHFFYFFNFKNYKKNFVTTNFNKFLNRWKNAQNLIFIVYFYEFNPLVFGSFDYKNEIMAINWQESLFDLKLWRYCCNFFIFKINKYGEKVFYFYSKLLNFDVNFFIISNTQYHYKNMYYFNRLKIFTLGLINSNFSPWLVSYPIPSISVNSLTEYFFLKLLLLFYRNALFFKYKIFKKNWLSRITLLQTQAAVVIKI